MTTDKAIEPVFGGNVAMPSSASLAGALKESATKDPRGGAMDGADYLNFSGKRGRFSYGADQKDFEMDRILVPNIAGFQDGWVCWKSGQPVATRLANIMGAPVKTPDFEEFGPFKADSGDGWFQAKGAMFKDIDSGDQFFFKINSVSGVSALAGLISDIADRAERGDPAWPVLTLDMSEFTARGHKNFKPVFNVMGWLDDERVGVAFNDKEADLQDLMGQSGNALSPVEDEPETEEAEPEKEPVQKSRRRRSAV
jgi:hypothetical protein